MKTNGRNYHIYLEDILTSMERVIEYIGNYDFEDFKNNTLIIDAVIRNFEIIGEATNNLPQDLKENYPDVPWRKMYALRNIISHEYFGIDYEMIWEIAKKNLPENIDEVRRILTEEKRSFNS